MTNEAPDAMWRREIAPDAFCLEGGAYYYEAEAKPHETVKFVRADLARPVKVKSTEGDAKRAILAKATLHFEDVADALAKGTDRERLSSAVLREVVVSLRKMSEEI